MEVKQVFRLWDQEIDLWFTNVKPVIPTLGYISIYENTLKKLPHLSPKICHDFT